MSGLRVENLWVRYGAVDAVRGISFSCGAGELVAFVGPNGAGKSSALLSIGGGNPDADSSGAVHLGGEPVLGLPAESVAEKGLMVVPEQRRIFPSLTVRENLLVGASTWAKRVEGLRAAEEMLERFPDLGVSADRAGALLSGGQQQQLAIARALMARPKLLLLDEPSLGLAPAMVDRVFETIAELRDQGIAIVLVEQAVAEAVSVATRCLAMRKGQIDMAVEAHELDRFIDAYFGSVGAAPT